MTEAEADKILDFLCKRFNGFYTDYSSTHAKLFTGIVIVDNKFFTMQFNRLCIEFLFMKNDSEKNSRFSYVWTSPNSSFFDSQGFDTHIYRVNDGVELSTKNVLEMLFEAAKTHNIFIEQNIFIHRGESLEEVMVKADLEDV